VRENGGVACYKSRLVAHGFYKRPGITFSDIYSSTISYAAIRVVLSKPVVKHKDITDLDIVTTFSSEPD